MPDKDNQGEISLEKLIYEAVSAGWDVAFAPHLLHDGTVGMSVRVTKREEYGLAYGLTVEQVQDSKVGLKKWIDKNIHGTPPAISRRNCQS